MKDKQKSAGKLGLPLGQWGRRMFLGASKKTLESPGQLTAQAFFRRKLAVVALILLVSLFLFVFFGPFFVPMDVSFTDPLQKNISPNYSMLRIPKALAGNIRDLNGVSNFTVGVSNDNSFYIWGYTRDALGQADLKNTPAEIQPGQVAFAAAGSDHIIAITTGGKIVGWGENSSGQYGQVNPTDPYIQMPAELLTGTIDPNAVDQLVCGYQVTALILDGRLYLWGNPNTMLSLREFSRDETFISGVKKVVFSNYYALILREDGTITGGSALPLHVQSAVSSFGNSITNLKTYLANKRVLDIAAAGNSYALVTSDGELIVFGTAQYGEKDLPQGKARFVSVSGGTRHFAAMTDTGLVYTWGHNDGGQASISGQPAARVFTGAKQTYLVDETGRLTQKAGMRGYLFGTDGLGRDVFARIIHGGRMTMTVGAVAVLVAAVIGVVIGCLSGYFGGWVDTLLMRITEIFSAIPFLPFAMLLSYVIKTMPIGENTRILIIMLILGLLSWTGLARMLRAQVLAEREKEFVTAARSMGLKQWRIAFRHILPNVISVILVSVTLDFAGCLLTESSLSYLGFGVQQPTPTWGNMLSGANNSIVIQNYWWQWVFPGLFLALATISINIIGDTLRDALDPKTNQER